LWPEPEQVIAARRRVVAIDIDPGMLALTREKIAAVDSAHIGRACRDWIGTGQYASSGGSDEHFEHYPDLNKAQRDIVGYLDGPLLVIAVPGQDSRFVGEPTEAGMALRCADFRGE
jgi:hypothetical protein